MADPTAHDGRARVANQQVLAERLVNTTPEVSPSNATVTDAAWDLYAHAVAAHRAIRSVQSQAAAAAAFRSFDAEFGKNDRAGP